MLDNRALLDSIVIDEDATLRDALRAIDRGGIGTAVIVSGRTFISLLTDGDVRRALLEGHGLEAAASIASPGGAVTAQMSASLADITTLFDERIRVVPILDDGGAIVDLALFDVRVHLPVASPTIGETELEYVTEAVLSGWVSSAGPFVDRFEKGFAEFTDTLHGVSCCNGTAGLHLALLAVGVGPGDEVIVPSFTFIATANAVTYTGATPVFVDCEPVTWTMDVEATRNAVTARTAAIIAVHLYGHPARMAALRKLADECGLTLIEDAAEAHGAVADGRVVGSIGHIGVFSFFGNKIITTGEGGMLVTDDPEIATKARMLRDHGMDPTRRYWHPVIGFNYRMTNLQAALGTAQLERVDQILAQKRRLSDRYSRGLAGVPGITTPPNAPWAKPVCWLYTVMLDEQVVKSSRDEIMDRLSERGVDTRPAFHPVHLQPPYAVGQHLPITERLGREGLTLPSAATLLDDEIDFVARSLVDVLSNA